MIVLPVLLVVIKTMLSHKNCVLLLAVLRRSTTTTTWLGTTRRGI
jgi:hypothetical protein